MKHRVTVLIFFLLIAFLVISLFFPWGLRSAIENNLWSVQFLKHFSGASTDLEELPAPPSTHSHAGLLLAHQALKENDLDKATSYLMPLVEAADPLAMDTYAEILYLKNDYEAAFQVWFNLRNDKSLEWASHDLNEKQVRGYGSLARNYACLLEPGIYCSTYELKLRIANELRDAGLFQFAIDAYELIVDQFPDDAHAYLELTQAYLLSGQIELAVHSFDLSLIHHPTGIPLLLSIAQLFEGCLVYTSALQAFQEVLILDPGNVSALQGVERLSNSD